MLKHHLDIHRSVASHLQSLLEVQAMLQSSVVALRVGQGAESASAALDGLCGVIEDVRIDIGCLTDVRHRLVLGIFVRELDACLQHLADWGLVREAAGLWALDRATFATRAERAAGIAADAIDKFNSTVLAPHLRAWGQPVSDDRAVPHLGVAI